MKTLPTPPALDIYDATHHIAQAVHLLLDALDEAPDDQLKVIGGARRCCVRAQAVLEALRNSLEAATTA